MAENIVEHMSESVSAETKKFFQPDTDFRDCSCTTTQKCFFHAAIEDDPVNHPKHYRPLPGIDFECIDVTRHLTFNVGNAVKYVWRSDAKNGRQDLEKAAWYLRDAIEHNDCIYAPFCMKEAQVLLDVVARCESDPNRKSFFYSIKYGQLIDASYAVTAMLAED